MFKYFVNDFLRTVCALEWSTCHSGTHLANSKSGKHAPCRKGLEILLVLPLYEAEMIKKRKKLSLNVCTDFSPNINWLLCL